MADKTLQELPQASELTGEELVLLEQNAEAKKASSGAFISKVAEEVAGAPGFEEEITNAVDDWLDENGLLVATIIDGDTLFVDNMAVIANYDEEEF